MEVAPNRQNGRPSYRRLRSWRLAWRLGLAAGLLALGYEGTRRLLGSNFHTVVSGRIYRGAQPSPSFIEDLARAHGVRTIINLRGCGLPVDWYARETRVLQELGLNQEDICFSAVRLPSALELRRLVDVLDRAEYPVYLHCRRGADRTGMASAIALLLERCIGGQTAAKLSQARKQLSIWYGHVTVGQTRVLDQFLDLYEEWLDQGHRVHDSETFRHWLLEEYRGGWCSARFEDFAPLQHSSRAAGGTIAATALVGRVGEPLGYRVRVRNTGTSEWRMRVTSRAGVHLGYQVWDGDCLIAEGRAGLWDRQVAPGEAVEITLVVPPVPRAGRLRLLVDMVEEQHCWFYQVGSEPHEEELIVAE